MRHIRMIGSLFAVALVLAGCAGTMEKLELATSVYKTATETTVPASAVIPVANSFNILKGTAANYGAYCIQQQMVPAICSATTRRYVIKAVRAGTKARDQMVGSLRNNEPAAASIYNVLVEAVNGLKLSPAANAQFGGVTQ